MARLNKTELAREVAQESGLQNGQSKLALQKSFELIARHLQAGDEVEVGGFGKFTLSDRAARQGRNPSTGLIDGRVEQPLGERGPDAEQGHCVAGVVVEVCSAFVRIAARSRRRLI